MSQDTIDSNEKRKGNDNTGRNLSMIFGAALLSAGLIYYGMDDDKHDVTCNVGGSRFSAADQIEACVYAAKLGLQKVGAHGTFTYNGKPSNWYPDVEDMNIKIIYNSATKKKEKSSVACHIAPEENAKDKMLACRVGSYDVEDDINLIEYVFD